MCVSVMLHLTIRVWILCGLLQFWTYSLLQFWKYGFNHLKNITRKYEANTVFEILFRISPLHLHNNLSGGVITFLTQGN